jgi:hypothetical protein
VHYCVAKDFRCNGSHVRNRATLQTMFRMPTLALCVLAGHLTQSCIHSHAFDRWQIVLVGLRDSQACQTRNMLLLNSQKKYKKAYTMLLKAHVVTGAVMAG